jgi:hypothetical protein
LIVLFVVFLLAFTRREQRAAAPLVRLGIFRLRSLTGGNLVSFCCAAAFAPLMFVLTLYMQQALHYPAISTGLAFLPLALVLMLVSDLVSRQVMRLGAIWFLVGGLLIFVLDLLLFTRIPADGAYTSAILPGMLVVAVGTGCVFPVIIITATSGVAPTEQGLASGLVNTTQQIGASVGLAIVSTVMGARSAALLQPDGSNLQTTLVAGLQAGVLVCAGCVLLATLVALVALRQHPTLVALAPLPSVEHSHSARPFALAVHHRPAQAVQASHPG